MTDVIVYDKASWHRSHETFPKDVREDASCLYGGFAFAWLLKNELVSEDFLADWDECCDALRQRDVTPAAAFCKTGGVLESEMATAEGNRFLEYLFNSEECDYYGMFEDVLCGELPSPYHVGDDWENCDRLSVAIDAVYAKWTPKDR